MYFKMRGVSNCSCTTGYRRKSLKFVFRIIKCHNFIMLIRSSLLILLLLSCSPAWYTPTDTMVRRGMQSGQIRIGASAGEVAEAIGGISHLCVKRRITAQGTYELWDLTTHTGLCGGNLSTNYVFIFKDSTLIEIREAHTVHDLIF
jgi:hypothetical protein